MIAALSLIGTLLVTPQIEKVKFSHIFESGKTISYELNVTGDQGGQSMVIDVAVDLIIGEKSEKGMGATISPKTLKISAAGNDMDQSSALSDMKTVLDENGVPQELELNGVSTFTSVMFILTYLPNKELEVGDSFDFKFTKGSVSVKGTGKFEGVEKLNEIEMQKLKISSTVTPESGGEGELTYSVLFDKAQGRVMLVTGKAVVEGQEMNILLKKKG